MPTVFIANTENHLRVRVGGAELFIVDTRGEISGGLKSIEHPIPVNRIALGYGCPMIDLFSALCDLKHVMRFFETQALKCMF